MITVPIKLHYKSRPKNQLYYYNFEPFFASGLIYFETFYLEYVVVRVLSKTKNSRLNISKLINVDPSYMKLVMLTFSVNCIIKINWKLLPNEFISWQIEICHGELF